jgi:hypothetical protein
LREQLAEAEREAARKREQEERRQVAERERVAAEREAALQLERTCKRDEDSLARLKAAGPTAGDDVVRFEQGLSCERIRPAVVALREDLASESVKEPLVKPPMTNNGESLPKLESTSHPEKTHKHVGANRRADYVKREAVRFSIDEREASAKPQPAPGQAPGSQTAFVPIVAPHSGRMMIGF